MKKPIRQLQIIQYLLRNGTYIGSYRDFAERITGKAENAHNIRLTLYNLVEAGVVAIESNRTADSKTRTIISIHKDWI